VRARVAKWGDGVAICLPKTAAESLRFREGQSVLLTIEGDTVLIRPSRPRYSIEELAGQMRSGVEPEALDNVNDPPAGGEFL